MCKLDAHQPAPPKISTSQGKHAQLAQLLAAMAFLPSGLHGLMAAYRDSYVTRVTPADSSRAAPPARSVTPPVTRTSRATTPVDGQAGGKQQDAAAAVWWAVGEQPPSADELVAAVIDVVQEFPVWESQAVEEVRSHAGWGIASDPCLKQQLQFANHQPSQPTNQPTNPTTRPEPIRPHQDAVAVMGLCRALGAAKWGVALAVVLVDTPTLAPFAAAHPALWPAFCTDLQARPDLDFMRELVEALALLPAAPAGDGGAAGQQVGGGAAAATNGGGAQQQPPVSPDTRARALAAARAGIGSVSAMVQLG
jgi:hypothetical protein